MINRLTKLKGDIVFKTALYAWVEAHKEIDNSIPLAQVVDNFVVHFNLDLDSESIRVKYYDIVKEIINK